MGSEMGKELWNRIREEFGRLEEMPAHEQAAALAALPEEVRREVAAMLEAKAESAGFLESSDVQTGTRIGPYRVVEEIGRGGMGVVYRAERVDGEFGRTVALKVAGGRLFAPESARRFVRERQILARIEHPNIVRLLDGGMANGQRYFVMDLIEGGPITEHCETRKLSLDARLRLFEEVCGAIQYAHQRMILHRDLKAGNIWVNRDGVVKVFDFGIAQMLDGENGGSNATLTGLNPVSLAAASPEQVRGEPLTFASDVYSLGLLLYEMVTGENPQAGTGVAMDTVMRRIFEEPPEAPGRKRPGLPRDLDAIVLKALEKDPERRYGSAGELAEEIRRLRSGHPVKAVAPSGWYRLQRFVVRSRVAVGAAAIVIAVMTAAGVNTARQARLEQQRFDDARRLIRKVIFEIQPGLQRFAGSTELRRTLIASTVEYLESVSRDAKGNPHLQRELARAYVEMGKVFWSPRWASLGDAEKGKLYLLRAEKLIEEALAAAPGDESVEADAAKVYTGLASHGLHDVRHAMKAVELAQKRVAKRPDDLEALEDLAGAYYAEGLSRRRSLVAGAAEGYRKAGEVYRKLLEKKPGDRQILRNIGLTQRFQAQVAGEEQRAADMLRHSRAASEISARLLDQDPESQMAQVDAATDWSTLAGALFWNGHREEAAPVRQRGLRLQEKIVANDGNAHTRLALSMGLRDYCTELLAIGALAKAEENCRRSFTMLEELKREGKLNDHLVRTMTQRRLGWVLVKRGRMKEGCALVVEALAAIEADLKKVPGSALLAREQKFAIGTLELCPAQGSSVSGLPMPRSQ